MIQLHLALHSLESMRELLEEILDDSLVVVAPAKNVIERRETVGLAALLLMVEAVSYRTCDLPTTPQS